VEAGENAYLIGIDHEKQPIRKSPEASPAHLAIYGLKLCGIVYKTPFERLELRQETPSRAWGLSPVLIMCIDEFGFRGPR
jgi:hypothetical protein